jgi:hypothetical protein
MSEDEGANANDRALGRILIDAFGRSTIERAIQKHCAILIEFVELNSSPTMRRLGVQSAMQRSPLTLFQAVWPSPSRVRCRLPCKSLRFGWSDSPDLLVNR